MSSLKYVGTPKQLSGLDNPILDFNSSVEILQKAERISVIGRSGGGKSTLSKALAHQSNRRFIPLDREAFWLPGWQIRPRDEIRNLITDFCKINRWVIDGTSPDSFDIRLPKTDVIVWLHLPAWQCLLSVYRRVALSYGKVRPEMAEGCPEKWPDREFISYIWNFERDFMPRVRAEISQHGREIPIIWLTNRSQVNKIIEQII